MLIRSLAKRLPLDLLLPALALAGLVGTILAGSAARTSASDFSDLKTLYSSAWCFTHGTNPYSIASIESVFVRQHMAVPATWFGHYPVYPPTTLALLAPFSLLPMTAAIYSLTVLSALVLAVAMSSLLRDHQDQFAPTWGWKAIFATLCAGGPLLSFALLVGNLSVLSTAFGILAFTGRERRHGWLRAFSLALAILIKPHLGIWVGVAMLLMHESTRRVVARRAAGIVGVFTALVLAMLQVKGSLGMQMRSLKGVLNLEAFPGSSMNISSRAVLPIEAQITSLQSLLGFWISNHALIVVASVAILGVAGWWLAKATLRVQSEEEATMAMGTWLAFGMLATYHRALDGIALLLLLPLVLNQLRRSRRDWRAWTMVGLYVMMSFGPSIAFIQSRVTVFPAESVLSFLLLRQAGIADLCLAITLFLTLRTRLQSHEVRVDRVRGRLNGWNVPLRELQPARAPAFRAVRLQKSGVAIAAGGPER